MTKLNLDINRTAMNFTPGTAAKTSAELVISTISNVVLLWSNQKGGLDEEQRKIYYKLGDAFEHILKTKKETLELVIDDQWIAFIRTAFKEVRFTPDILTREVEKLLCVEETSS